MLRFHPRLVLLAIVLILFGGLTSPATAQEATPGTGLDRAAFVPAPDECLATPLTPEDIEVLLTAAPAGLPASPVASGGPFVAPDGEPADPETAAAVTAVIRESWACLNGGNWAGFMAYLTEDEVLQNFAPEDITGLTGQPVSPLPDAEQTAVYAILDVEVLPDGRVGAFVVVDTGGDPLPVEINYQIATETDDGWLLDDFICFSATGALC